MDNTNAYEESIISKWTVLLVGVVAAGLLVAFLYQVTGTPLGTRPAPDWFYLVMFVFFVVILRIFYRLRIRVGEDGVSAGYGLLSHTVRLEDIEDYYVDKASVIQYGGWGIRLGRVGGNWRLAFNTLENPRVVIRAKQGTFREFAFSAKDPDQVIEAINRKLRKRA